jgi:hypothetical protein
MFLDSMDWLCGSIVSGQVFIQGVLLHANADFSEKVVTRGSSRDKPWNEKKRLVGAQSKTE